MGYKDFKDLAIKTAFVKVLTDKAFNIAKTLNMVDIKGGWLLWFSKILKSPLQAIVLLTMRLNKIYN